MHLVPKDSLDADGKKTVYWGHLPLTLGAEDSLTGKEEPVNLDSFDYWSRLKAPRTRTIILACIASGWRFWAGDPRFPPPDNHVPGHHGNGGNSAIVLFADMHVKIVPWDAVGYF
jgi:hypothetical protein